MDVPFWNHSRTLRTAVVAGHHRRTGVAPAYPACNRDEVTLVRAGTADLTGSAVL
jgi:hypothetical protein